MDLLMIRLRHWLFTPLCFLVLSGVSAAQLTQAKDHRIVFGHLHLHPSSIEAHKKFWIDTLGGKATKVGTTEAALFPDGLVELGSPTFGDTKPTGGTKTSSVNHAGFSVPDVRAMVERVRAAGYPIITRAELPPALVASEKDGVAAIPNSNTAIAFVMGPDDFKVEFYETKGQKTPIAMHHIHFSTPQVPEMKAWYAKLLDAQPGQDGSLSQSPLRGSDLLYTPTTAPVVGTKGRVLDHIGFEIRGLEAFAKKLEEMGLKPDRPYMKANVGGFGTLGIVYLTDPWGTYIELTEGLDRVE